MGVFINKKKSRPSFKSARRYVFNKSLAYMSNADFPLQRTSPTPLEFRIFGALVQHNDKINNNKNRIRRVISPTCFFQD